MEFRRLEWDFFCRKTSVTDAVGTWTFTYDGTSNRILTVSDPDGNVTAYEYDSSGRRTRMTLTVNGTAERSETADPIRLRRRAVGATGGSGKLSWINRTHTPTAA